MDKEILREGGGGERERGNDSRFVLRLYSVPIHVFTDMRSPEKS